MASYTYTFTDNSSGSPVPTSFSLGGISEDAAKGIRFGLKKVPTIFNVNVERVVETRDALPAGDPTP